MIYVIEHGNRTNNKTMHTIKLCTVNPRLTRWKSIMLPLSWLSMPGNSQLMHCGILCDKPYSRIEYYNSTQSSLTTDSSGSPCCFITSFSSLRLAAECLTWPTIFLALASTLLVLEACIAFRTAICKEWAVHPIPVHPVDLIAASMFGALSVMIAHTWNNLNGEKSLLFEF